MSSRKFAHVAPLAAILCVALLPACAQAAFTARAGDTVLADVTVIRGDGSAALPDQAIVLRGREIAWTGPVAALTATDTARRLPVAGQFVLPGFMDMHAHLAVGPVETRLENGVQAMSMQYDADVARAFAGQLLDHGVTTVRNPAGPAEDAVAVRDAIARGEWRGPRVFTAGEVLDQTRFPGLATEVHTADQVRREVERQAMLGVDIIKLYQTLTPDLVRAGIDAAHAHGLPAIAHLMATDWTTAAELGIDGIAHMLPASPALLPEPRRQSYLAGITGTQMLYQWFTYADLDAPEIVRMIATLAREDVHFDPTLVAVESIFFADQPRITRNPALASVPRALHDNWRGGFSFTQGWSKDDFARAHAAFGTALQLTKRMYDGGVPLLAGTDLCMPWLAAGDSFHRELELLVSAGIPAREVIRIVTLNGATALGIADEVGTVVAGKRADLVLLDADPLADIRNTRQISHVIQNGDVVYVAEELP